MLNVDYKIATIYIANRIQPILPSIISPARTVFQEDILEKIYDFVRNMR